MKSFKTFGLALVAVFALGALSASAATAYEWRISGFPVSTPVETSATS